MTDAAVSPRQRPGAHVIFVRYVLFAVIAGLANLIAQEAVLRIVAEFPLVSVIFGTGIGFVVKYALEKRWVFYDRYDNHRAEARKVIVYGLFGVGTTLLFWAIELGFWHVGGTAEAKYLGAVIGLGLGNWIKYLFDKRFVFARAAG